MSSDWGAAGRGALGMGATGAGIGSMFAPGVGTAIGGGIGALAGGLTGLFGSGDSEEDIYKRLMQEYLNSPERARQQKSLDDLQAQATTQGPTAQEKTALDQAMRTANDQFGSSYGSILSNLRARSAGGGGGAAEAALAAAEGQARSGGMFQMAEGAAAQESARQNQARQAYANMALQVQNIGDQYRQWASGRAHNDRMVNEAAGMGTLAQGANAVAQGVAAYNQSQKDPVGGMLDAKHDSELGSGGVNDNPMFGPGWTNDQLQSHRQVMDLGFKNFLTPSTSTPTPTGVGDYPQRKVATPGQSWQEGA